MTNDLGQDQEAKEPAEAQKAFSSPQVQNTVVLERQRYEAFLIELGELRKESQLLSECRRSLEAKEMELKLKEREIEELKEILLETEWKDYELEQTQKHIRSMQLEMERLRKGPWWKRLLGI